MKASEVREPVHIGKVVRNALLFKFRDPRGGTVSDSALLEAVSRLFALLEERRIDYLLVGGIALLQYVEGRNTEDIDLIMAMSSLERLPELRKTSLRHRSGFPRQARKIDFIKELQSTTRERRGASIRRSCLHHDPGRSTPCLHNRPPRSTTCVSTLLTST
jgi:hypothetical protein